MQFSYGFKVIVAAHALEIHRKKEFNVKCNLFPKQKPIF